MNHHIEEQLSDYLLDLCDHETIQMIEAHAAECPDCHAKILRELQLQLELRQTLNTFRFTSPQRETSLSPPGKIPTLIPMIIVAIFGLFLLGQLQYQTAVTSQSNPIPPTTAFLQQSDQPVTFSAEPTQIQFNSQSPTNDQSVIPTTPLPLPSATPVAALLP